jgi:hypothetical protein
MYKYLLETFPSIPLSVHPEVELMDHLITLYFIFREVTMLFSTVHHFYLEHIFLDPTFFCYENVRQVDPLSWRKVASGLLIKLSSVFSLGVQCMALISIGSLVLLV